MAVKMVPEMASISEAIKTAYSELYAIRTELDSWLSRKGPRTRRDVTISTATLWEIVDDYLEKIIAPDLTTIPSPLAEYQVCVNLSVGSKSRETRRQNAMARLRPAVAALRKAGMAEISGKLKKDITHIDFMPRIPGAYE